MWLPVLEEGKCEVVSDSGQDKGSGGLGLYSAFNISKCIALGKSLNASLNPFMCRMGKHHSDKVRQF